ncbi:MAG: thioredoxin [Nitrospirota bacterium]
MGKVLSVDNSTWDKEVISAGGLVMVDFWAVWCGPCQMVGPIVEELASEYEGKIKVLKLNTDDNPEIASRYQIMSIPTLNFFKDGKVIDRIVGAAPKKQFKEKIDQILAKV